MTWELKAFNELPKNHNFMGEPPEPRARQSPWLYEIPKYIGPEAYPPEQRVEWTNFTDSTTPMPFPGSFSPMYLQIWSMIGNLYDQLSKLCASFHNVKCIVYGIDIFHESQTLISSSLVPF
jgi:hypothetical protein